MKYRTLGKLNVSVVGLGTMSWPGCRYGVHGSSPSCEDIASVQDMVRTALDDGINLIDTAEGYGRGLAEDLLGSALEDLGRRDEAVIVTKVGPLFDGEKAGGRECNLSASHMISRCDESLKRLRTDHIDLYLAHRPDPSTPIAETMQAAEELQKQGKILEFGVSNFDHAALAGALEYGPVAANQLAYNLVERWLEADVQPLCLKSGVGLMAYSPLGKGVLSGKYDEAHLPASDDYRHGSFHFSPENLPRNMVVARRLRELAAKLATTPSRLALAWVLARPGVSTVLPGAKSPAQIRDNAAAAELVLHQEILDSLSAISPETK